MCCSIYKTSNSVSSSSAVAAPVVLPFKTPFLTTFTFTSLFPYPVFDANSIFFLTIELLDNFNAPPQPLCLRFDSFLANMLCYINSLAYLLNKTTSQAKQNVITSNSALMSFAFLLSIGPTAWKFLSRSSANSSSEEFKMIFFGSDRSATADVVGPTETSDEAANFSAGSLTVAET